MSEFFNRLFKALCSSLVRLGCVCGCGNSSVAVAGWGLPGALSLEGVWCIGCRWVFVEVVCSS